MVNTIVSRLGANYRYIVLWASMLALLVGSGSIFLLVVVLKPISAEFDWPRTVPSMAYALQFLCAGVGAIVMGSWFDRSGIGPLILLGAIMISIGAFVVSGMSTQWEFLVTYGLFFGFLGQATLFSPLMANIVNLFERRRGFAAGVVASGQAFAGTFWPPIVRYFNDDVGWRETYFYFGIFTLCTMLPISLVFLWQKKFIVEHRLKLAAANAHQVDDQLDGFARNGGVAPSIWMVTLSIGILGCCVAMALPLAHIVSHMTDIGHPAVRAAEVLALALLVAGVTRLTIMGYVSDRLGSLPTLFLFSCIQTSMVGMFVVVDNLTGLYLIGIIFGVGYGGILPLYPVVIRDHLSSVGIGRRTAVVIFFGGVGMALGGWFGGFLFDLSGSYVLAFMLGAGANAINLVIVGMLLLRLRSVRTALIYS
jgi:MFS family permease